MSCWRFNLSLWRSPTVSIHLHLLLILHLCCSWIIVVAVIVLLRVHFLLGLSWRHRWWIRKCWVVYPAISSGLLWLAIHLRLPWSVGIQSWSWNELGSQIDVSMSKGASLSVFTKALYVLDSSLTCFKIIYMERSCTYCGHSPVALWCWRESGTGGILTTAAAISS